MNLRKEELQNCFDNSGAPSDERSAFLCFYINFYRFYLYF